MYDDYEAVLFENLKEMSKREREEHLAMLEVEDYGLYQDACFTERWNEKIHKQEAWAY